MSDLSSTQSKQLVWLLAVLLAGSLLALVWVISSAKQRDVLALAESQETAPLPKKKLSATKPAPANASITAYASVVVKEQPNPTLAGIDPEIVALREKLESAPDAVPNEVLLTFRDETDLQRFAQLAKGKGLQLLSTVAGKVGRFHYQELAQLQGALKLSGANPALEPTRWMAVPRLPPAPPPEPNKSTNNQGGSVEVGAALMESIGAGQDRSTWGQGVKVAVLDTGMQRHPTFRDSQISHYDLVGDGSKPHNHAQGVGSLIAGSNPQVPGLAPAAEILDFRVADDKGISVTPVIAQAIYDAVAAGAAVINISMGGYGDSQVVRDALAYAESRQVHVVAAAGNENYDQLAFPAAVSSVIAVGSVDGDRRQAEFSNSGRELDISAPGVGLYVAWGTDKLAQASGTSHSTALVSGAVAALRSRGYSYADVERLLKNWAKPTGAPASQVGAGVLYLNLR
jgi:thermitase